MVALLYSRSDERKLHLICKFHIPGRNHENKFPLKETAVLIVLVNPGMKSQMKMTCSFLRKRLFFSPNYSNKYW